MKNSTVKLVSKLIAAIPGAAFFGRTQPANTQESFGKKNLEHLNQQENLNRIFMVRYRIQHL